MRGVEGAAFIMNMLRRNKIPSLVVISVLCSTLHSAQAAELAEGTPSSFSSTYKNFDDPSIDHSNAAIQFQREGKLELAMRAFRAAARFHPSLQTYMNLGVALMRSGRLTEAAHAMHKAKTYDNAGTDPLLRDNWDKLLQLMKAAGVDLPKLTPLKGLDNESKGKGTEEINGRTHREGLIHQHPSVPRAKEIPRMTWKTFESLPQFSGFSMPVIITDGMENWQALHTWKKFSHIVRTLGSDTVTDFYPHNLRDQRRQAPYLTLLGTAVLEIRRVYSKKVRERLPTSRFQPAQGDVPTTGRYLHVQATPRAWSEMERISDLSPTRHSLLQGDGWMRACLQSEELIEEFHLKTHWKVVLIGTKGAGMFNHTDSLQTSSWHAHVRGRKWWHICAPEKGCYEDYVKPGEILGYSNGWWHTTQNLKNPTITVTGTIVTRENHKQVAEMLQEECVQDKFGFKFSAQLCDALDSCYGAWERAFSSDETKETPSTTWKGWRARTSAENLKAKESWLPTDNMYDGRNFITG